MSIRDAVAAYAILPGPWGPVHVAVGRAGVVAVEVLTPTEAFVARLRHRLRGEVEPSAAVGRGDLADLLDRAVDQVEAFLGGDRRSFDLPLQLDDRPAWDREILAAVADVPWGQVTSYGRVARRVGRPGAARAVGGAVGRNPVGLLVPCHRVIAGDGSLGGYGGEWYGSREEFLAIKRTLLEREGVHLPVRTLA